MKEVKRLKEALEINKKGNNKENANKEKLEVITKENKQLKEKYHQMELLYKEIDRDLRDKDIWIGERVEELKEESWMKELEWIKEKEVLTQEVETCLTEKRIMEEELDRARLEIYALRQYKQLK